MALNGKSDTYDLSKIESLDDFFAKTQYIGSLDKALSNNLYGINHQTIKPMIQDNKDSFGLAFFTRPQLNLTAVNIRNIRTMYSLLSSNKQSIHMYVRNMLDPRLYTHDTKPIRSLLVDNEMAFIPILTNTIKNMSGWPDIVLPTFTSKQGVRGQQWSIGDGYTEVLDAFDMDCTFRNVRDEPIVLMMETWVRYISEVFEGMMSPYLDMIRENEIDYNTRIYRVILDESKHFVKKIAATGASFPVNVPTGRMFDFSDSQNYNDQNKDINIRFKCMGAMYNDDILIDEFNRTTGIFNKDMRDLVNAKANGKPYSGNMVKIPFELLSLFNNRGYPYINPEYLQLEWYVRSDSQTYKNIMN
jgi:hypothetical protein